MPSFSPSRRPLLGSTLRSLRHRRWEVVTLSKMVVEGYKAGRARNVTLLYEKRPKPASES